MLSSALALAKNGMAVFPCRVRDKRPATANGCTDATSDLDQIRAWWQQDENFNIAIATGAKSGIFVVDIDDDDGAAALARMGVMPDTVVATTAKGEHFYFKMPKCDLRNSASKIADGVDIRGNGGYVLAPPSIHPSGARYAWDRDSARAFAEAPDWLLDKLTDQPRERAPVDVSGLMADAPEGERNDRLARLAGHLLRHRVHVEMVHALLLAWNEKHCVPPLDDVEVLRVISSICKCEEKRRGKG
jgi:hypothetical protein